jgi:hypothetical protein
VLTGIPTSLSQATAFLWADYRKSCYWWEPIEMFRKLILTGAVLLQPIHTHTLSPTEESFTGPAAPSCSPPERLPSRAAAP